MLAFFPVVASLPGIEWQIRRSEWCHLGATIVWYTPWRRALNGDRGGRLAANPILTARMSWAETNARGSLQPFAANQAAQGTPTNAIEGARADGDGIKPGMMPSVAAESTRDNRPAALASA